jgi:hypothetical protein
MELKLQPRQKILFWLLLLIIGIASFRISDLGLPNIKPYLSFPHFFSFYKQYTAQTDQPKVLVIWGHGYGEREHKQRLMITAKRLGIEMKGVSNEAPEQENDRFQYKRNKIAARIFKPDLVLIIEGWEKPIDGYKNFVILAWPYTSFMGLDYPKYAGVLPVFTDFSPLPPEAKVLFHYYPSVYKTDYANQAPRKLFYSGGIIYDQVRGSMKYRDFFSMLDKTGYLELYGTEKSWQHTPNSLKAPLPFDGVSIIKAANEAGISLVLHGQEQFNAHMPSGRIFEAAAANTVIISDQNKFVQQQFGDNVLYVDTKQDAATMFAQVDAHVRWIFANPEKARHMAENCYTIANEKFNLEDQLQNILAAANQ